MKQAKIALTAVAVLAVVGGALAFKATQNRLAYVDDANLHCTVSTQLPYTSTTATTTNGIDLIKTKVSFASTTAPCPVTTVRTIQ